MQYAPEVDERKVYTVPEVAELFGVKRDAVYGWIRRGKLRAVKVGGRYRIKGSDLKALVRWT